MKNSYYLRLSVTEDCNYRCVYCRPASGAGGACSGSALDDHEIALLVGSLHAGVGLRKVRLTGGEPLMRPDLAHLVLRLREILPLAELALTTNGSLLSRDAASLRRAGLDSVNVSLDVASPASFNSITRGGNLDQVLRGIRAAKDAGFAPPKLNAVLMRGYSLGRIGDLVRLAGSLDCEIRFIELMPLGEGAGLFAQEYLSSDEALAELILDMDYVQALPNNATSQRHLLRDGNREYRVGFITTMSEPFCRGCDRLRLNSRGVLYTCLRDELGVDLSVPLRRGDFDFLRERTLMAVAGKKPPARSDAWPRRSMVGIGG